MVLAEQTQDEIFEASVRSQLELIDAALLRAAEADSEMVTEAAQHIIAAGGKRFRPLLVVLGSHLGPREATEDVVKAAVVVELTHVASLYHDDVMDEAGIRRGSPSANSRWGNTVAILVGDLLFARVRTAVAIDQVLPGDRSSCAGRSAA
jgi:heptaprenyl diphosphate synthase